MLNLKARILIVLVNIGIALCQNCPSSLIWKCNEIYHIEANFSGVIITDCGNFYPKSSFEEFFGASSELYDRSKTYTLIMVDPDAPGSHAGKGWLHMIRSGITGHDLAPGSLAANGNHSGTDITPYGKPTPPKNTGDHRYFLYLYEEQGPSPNGEIGQRRNFDIQDFASKNNLCGPVGMNMFITKF